MCLLVSTRSNLRNEFTVLVSRNEILFMNTKMKTIMLKRIKEISAVKIKRNAGF